MDFNTLITEGNIGFYKSCEVTEIFLFRKRDKTVSNFFTIAVFEEKPFSGTNEAFIGERIPFKSDYFVGIKRYWQSIDEAKNCFETLRAKNKWAVNGNDSSQFPKLKYLPKQFVPATEGNRLNNVLKNNFHSGSYILEFFDEEKTTVDVIFKIEELKNYNTICDKIQQQVPIDLSVARDRVGNFIFQFPVTILNAQSKPLPTRVGVDLSFSWHSLLPCPLDCLLQVESTIDKNYMGATIEEYNKTDSQRIMIGNIDQLNHIKIWRKEPSLILSIFSGTFISGLQFNMGIVNSEPRIFEIEGEVHKVMVSSVEKIKVGKGSRAYTTFINSNLYDDEKKNLEKTLSFKQYNNIGVDALTDLRKLIEKNDEYGVYLWDPFLSSTDILNTLYYSKSANVPLLAIGSIGKTVKTVYGKRSKTEAEIILEYRNNLDNPSHNNFHLNLEFRIQHSGYGWEFHDRFLIFPGSEDRKPKVYSLGTSLNSFGKNHHILQEVSHPQPIVDAFNELWDKLNHPDCIVWKFPK